MHAPHDVDEMVALAAAWAAYHRMHVTGDHSIYTDTYRAFKAGWFAGREEGAS